MLTQLSRNKDLSAAKAIQTLNGGIRKHDTLIFFPICWQACFGSRDRFDEGTSEGVLNPVGIALAIPDKAADAHAESRVRNSACCGSCSRIHRCGSGRGTLRRGLREVERRLRQEQQYAVAFKQRCGSPVRPTVRAGVGPWRITEFHR